MLDPAFAPGARTPEPSGLARVDLLCMVRRIAMETNLIAMDLVEVSPPYDQAGLTVNNAHRLVWKALAGLAYRRRVAAARSQGETP